MVFRRENASDWLPCMDELLAATCTATGQPIDALGTEFWEHSKGIAARWGWKTTRPLLHKGKWTDFHPVASEDATCINLPTNLTLNSPNGPIVTIVPSLHDAAGDRVLGLTFFATPETTSAVEAVIAKWMDRHGRVPIRNVAIGSNTWKREKYLATMHPETRKGLQRANAALRLGKISIYGFNLVYVLPAFFHHANVVWLQAAFAALMAWPAATSTWTFVRPDGNPRASLDPAIDGPNVLATLTLLLAVMWTAGMLLPTQNPHTNDFDLLASAGWLLTCFACTKIVDALPRGLAVRQALRKPA